MSIYRWAKLDDQSGPDRSIELSLLDLLTDLLHMIFVLLAEDVVLRQVPLHSQRMGEASQTTAKQHPVKAGHHTLDILLEFGDKLLHGVSPWFSVADLIHPTTYIIRGTPNTACGLPLCGADLQVCAGPPGPAATTPV